LNSLFTGNKIHLDKINYPISLWSAQLTPNHRAFSIRRSH